MTTDRPFSLQDAWLHVGELYDWIVSLFGAPRALADRRILLSKTRHDILAWLGPVEALARRLLLLKALSLPPANAPPTFSAKGRVVSSFADRPTPALAEDAETWRVRFAVWPHGHARKSTNATPPETQRRGAITESALPLARRLEALRRVLDDPAPTVARLVRLLVARRETAPAAFAPYRPRALPCATALEEAQAQVAAAWNTS